MRASRGITLCFFLSLVGIGLSSYLAFLHFGLQRGELLGGPACGTGAFNCHAVTAGPWGAFLGMPLALWGILGYAVVFALSLLGQQSAEWADHTLTCVFLLAAVFLVIDLVLFFLMVFVIRLYCLFCLLTYALNASLLVAAGRSLSYPWPQTAARFGAALGTLTPSRQRPAARMFWGIVLLAVWAVAGLHGATTYLSRGTFGSLRKQLREYLTKQPRVTIDVTGDPSMGPANASLQIIEFSDFLCPACQRSFKLNAIMLANHRHDARFIFKHYPLDTSCNDKVSRTVHPGACQVAAASECAHLQGKFWPFHDLVFEAAPHYNVMGIDEDVKHLGLDMAQFGACMDSGQGLVAVKRDIAAGSGMGVVSTPTYLLNGVPISGGLNPSMFEDFVAVLKESGS